MNIPKRDRGTFLPSPFPGGVIALSENDEEAFADLEASVYIADYGDYQVVVGLEIPSVAGLPAHYWLVEHFIFR